MNNPVYGFKEDAIHGSNVIENIMVNMIGKANRVFFDAAKK